MPLHRLALGDPQDTNIYISDKTGEVVMKTTGSSRRWAYAGGACTGCTSRRCAGTVHCGRR